MKKRFNKEEYVKYILTEAETKCDGCKYYYRNYYDIDSDAITFFSKEKCRLCKHHYLIEKKEVWITDKFKPLYDWEGE